MRKIGSLLTGIATNLGLDDAIRLQRIREHWNELFGHPLALRARPRSVFESVLHMQVDSPLWLQQISYYEKEILEKLKPFGITGLRLTTGKSAPVPPTPDNSARPPAGAPDREPLTEAEITIIEKTVEPLKDESLMEISRSIMRQAIRRKEGPLREKL